LRSLRRWQPARGALLRCLRGLPAACRGTDGVPGVTHKGPELPWVTASASTGGALILLAIGLERSRPLMALAGGVIALTVPVPMAFGLRRRH
jgi:hypothetical protein